MVCIIYFHAVFTMSDFDAIISNLETVPLSPIRSKRMNTAIVYEFMALAKLKNYTRAAQNLDITVSTLTKHIHLLEGELGQALFIRSTRHVELSEYGLMFLPYAESILKTESEVDTVFKRQQQKKDILHIASMAPMRAYHILDAIGSMSLCFTNCSVRYHEGETRQLTPMLSAGMYSLAIVYSYNDLYQDFQVIDITSDRLVAAVREDHPLAGKASVSLSQLKEEPFLFLSVYSILYDFCQRLCRPEFSPKVVLTDSQGTNLLDFVRLGFGNAVLFRETAEALPHSGVRLIDLAPIFKCGVCVICLKDHVFTRSETCFIDDLKRYNSTPLQEGSLSI